MFTINMLISNLKFFVLLINISRNKDNKKNSFIFRINRAAWNKLCFSQGYS